MTPIQLIDWRKRFKFTQGKLAKFIGVDRKTLNRWENGISPMPVDIHSRLPIDALEKPVEELFVCPGMKDTRRDLKLFDTVITSNQGKVFIADVEHPRRLLSTCGQGRIPLAVLDSVEYLEALAVHRAKNSA